jgi:uncharacterized protein (TIGR00251 family)
MVDYTQTEKGITFRVFVVPRASRSELAGEHEGALRVRIAAPPVEGAANDELIRLLSRAAKLPRSTIEIVRGQNSRLKTITICGARPAIIKLLEG